MMKYKGISIAAALILCATAAMAQTTWDPSIDLPAARRFAALARNYLAMNLRDFSSAQYPTEVQAGYQIIDGTKHYFLVGHLNARNGFGAYTGPMMFIIVDRDDGMHMAMLDGSTPSARTVMELTRPEAVNDLVDDFRPLLRP